MRPADMDGNLEIILENPKSDKANPGDIIMKLSHALAGTIALTIFSATIPFAAPAHAQAYDPRYPVCLQVYDDMVHFTTDCSFTTMAQCAATASGRYAQCVVNPYYAGPNTRRAPRKKHGT